MARNCTTTTLPAELAAGRSTRRRGTGSRCSSARYGERIGLGAGLGPDCPDAPGTPTSAAATARAPGDMAPGHLMLMPAARLRRRALRWHGLAQNPYELHLVRR